MGHQSHIDWICVETWFSQIRLHIAYYHILVEIFLSVLDLESPLRGEGMKPRTEWNGTEPIGVRASLQTAYFSILTWSSPQVLPCRYSTALRVPVQPTLYNLSLLA